jgi:hypothetical protein
MSAATTKRKVAKGDTKPKQDWNEIGQAGLKAQGMAVEYATIIGARLSAAWLTSYGADVTALPLVVPQTITTHAGAVQLTSAQATALENGYNLIRGIRETVKSFSPAKDVLLGYGIGTGVDKALVKEVTAALQTIIARLEANTAEATSFDIVAVDLAGLQAALLAIQQSDTAQEAGRASAPLSTQQRNATGRRVMAGIRKIAGAGMRAFSTPPNVNATIYANFAGLISKKKAT